MSSPHETFSLSLKSFDLFPEAPRGERLALSSLKHEAIRACIDDLRIPFPLLEENVDVVDKQQLGDTSLRLSMTPSRNELVTKALHRMSSSSTIGGRPILTAPSPPCQLVVVNDGESIAPLVDRMTRLMARKEKSPVGLKARRSASPVPLVRGEARGVNRTNSGAALCA